MLYQYLLMCVLFEWCMCVLYSPVFFVVVVFKLTTPGKYFLYKMKSVNMVYFWQVDLVHIIQ